MYISHFILSSIHRYLGCFHYHLAVVNNAGVNPGRCSYLLEIVILFPSDIFPKAGLPDRLIILFFDRLLDNSIFYFLTNLHTVSAVAVSLYISTTVPKLLGTVVAM